MKILKKNSAYIIEIEQSEKETGRTMYNTRHELAKLITHKERLQSNWNSLRKCVIGVIEEAREELNTIIHTTDIGTKDGLKYVNQCSREFDVIRKNLEIVLDKMNELEGKDKK